MTMSAPYSPLPSNTRVSPLAALAVFCRITRNWMSRCALKRTASCCIRSTALVAFCLAAPFLVAADWQWLSPSPTGNRINSFAHGGGQFVGVGNSGEIVTSPDGATWTTRESGIQDSFNRVVYDGTRFVAIGGTNLLTSSNGILWAKQNAPANLTDLAAGNNLLVAIANPAVTGQPYRFLASPDGINWTSTDSPGQPMRILFTNGVFVAVDTIGRALASTDGVTWTVTQLPEITTTPFFAAGNGVFLASYWMKSYVSVNGTVWREVTSHRPAPSGSQGTLTVPYLQGGIGGSTMGFAGGYFYLRQSRYAQDPNSTYRSADGETWEAVPTFYNGDLSTLASGGGVMVESEVATYYYGPNPTGYAIHSSGDGLTWTKRSNALTNSGTSLVYGLGRFFAGGQVSSDGLTWAPTPFEPTHTAGDLVFRVTSKFWADSAPSTTIDARAVTSVEVSADGLTGLPVDVKMATPRSVAFGSGRYVFVGDGGSVSSSTDALTWTAGTSGTTNDLQAVIFAFNRFVAVGTKGTLATSPDGLAWTVENTATTIDFLCAAAGSDRIVVGTVGSATTVPALTLSGNLTVQIATARRSDALIWFNGEFTSVEHYSPIYYSSSISFAKSTDGNTWSAVPLRYPWAAGGRAMLATGNGTALLVLPAGTGWSLEKLFTAVFQSRISASSAPVVTHAPAATSVHRGETATFSVGVTGSGALAFQWNHNGTPIAGATSQVLSLPLTKDSDAGDYTVTVSNSLGSATSAAAKLTVQAETPLTITKQPVGGTLYANQSFYLTIEVTGSGPITYQWRRNGTPFSTSPTLEIYPVSYSMDNYTGTYDVVITAPYSTVTSQAVVLSRSGPVVTVSQSGGTTQGNTLTITANATGKSPFTYAWSQTVGGSVVGANDATLVFPNLASNDAGPYRVTVTDADGLSTDTYFTVTVSGSDPAPTSAQATAAPGQKLTLRAPFSGSDSVRPSFQWSFKNTPITGATAWSYTTPAISEPTAGDYSVVVTPTSGVATTYTTTVALGSVASAPAFAAQTASRTVAAGATTTFSVSPGNTSVSSYQWQVSTNNGSTWTNLTDGGPYSGTTTQTLTITGATAAMNGYKYLCVANNSSGMTTSLPATLSINNDPLLVYPVAIARDSSGNLFVSDASANVIRKITPAGAASIFAGAAGNAGSLDGTGSAARFNQPGGLAFDSAGNLYIADTGNATIRKITAAGVVTTLAGNPAVRGNADATGNAATFNHPVGLAVDAAGNIYVADTFTHTVRKITSGGTVTTLAGSNAVAGSADGSGAAARFSGPAGVAVDAGGNVYVADTGNNTLRKITASGAVTTLAGLPGVGGSNDGTGGSAFFSQPTSLVVDTAGAVYVADTGNNLIRHVTSAGAVTLLAGVPGIAGLSDGVGLDALLDQPHGMALDGSGALYVADTGNAALRKITANGTVTTLALVAVPPPTPDPVITTPTTPTTPSGGGTSTPAASGGGGAINPWLAGTLALLFALRRLRRTAGSIVD